MGTDIEELVEIFVKPSRSVRAKKALAIGELVALPEAVGVKILDRLGPAEEVPAGHAEVFLSGEPEGVRRRVLLTGSTSSDSVCPFWCFERTTDSREVNMIPVLYKVQLCGGPDAISDTKKELASAWFTAQSGASAKASPRPPAASSVTALRSRTLRAVASCGSSQEESLERFVYVPVLVNCEAVDEGAELKVEKDASVAPPKTTEPIQVTSLAKKGEIDVSGPSDGSVWSLGGRASCGRYPIQILMHSNKI